MTALIPAESGQPAPRAEIVMVPFLGGHIPCAWWNGEPMVVPKPISDGLGLNWAGQYTKLSADQTACVEFISIQMPGDDQARKAMVISLETFTLWLGGLQPSRVKPEARDTVIAYKREAGRALREHFFGKPAAGTEIAFRQAAGDDLDVIQNLLTVNQSIVTALRATRDRVLAVETSTRELTARLDAAEGRSDWFTALGYAKLHGHPTTHRRLAKVGKRASALMRARGEEPDRRQDATYGSVGLYPTDVLEQAFEETA